MSGIVINATPSDPAANSYCEQADADAYYLGHINHTLWDSATPDQKARALVTATRLLDEHVDWDGYASSDTQALQWPRFYMRTEKRLFLYPRGEQPFDWWSPYYVDPTIIPDRLKQATSEFARQLLVCDRTEDDELSRKQITGIKAGSVDITFKGYAQPQVIPDAVFYFVQIWGQIRHRAQISQPLRRC